MTSSRFAVTVIGCMLLISCGNGDRSRRSSGPGESAAASGGGSQAANVDQCTFFSRAELEAAFGLTLRPGQSRTGEPACDFESNDRRRVTVSVGPPHSVSVQEFNELRETIGPEAEPVSGIGDAAFFWWARIYVTTGNRQLTISRENEAKPTPELRAALTSLAKTGVARLKARG